MGSYWGTSGNDTLMGEEGKDWLYGYSGDDSLSGGDGKDWLSGGEDNDSLSGENDKDWLIGDSGNDSLAGGDGNDSLVGGQGNDTLVGGQGSDRFAYTSSGTIFSPVNLGVDVISDFETGSDKIVLDKSLFTSISSTEGIGWSLIEEFATVATDADAATSTANIIYNSVNGNLFYNANGSAPGLGTGSLLLTLTAAPTLVATDFILDLTDLYFYGSQGDDSVASGEGDDSLYGEEGNDFLDGGKGDDSLYGGEGNDSLLGGEGDDSLYGEEGNDSLLGGEGDNSLYGEEGNDSLYGEEGNDFLDGGKDNDFLDGGEGNDTLYGGEGNDSLIGSEGSDQFVYSKPWFDSNPVNFGVDVISDFETGSDKIVLDKSCFTSISSPVGTELSLLGEFATVTNDADAATSSADIVYNLVNGNLFYNANGSDSGFGTGSLLLTLTGAPTLVATDFTIEASPPLDSGAGDDSLVGGEVSDNFYGNDGNDSLYGGNGNDTLSGGNGNDILSGENGNDSLDGWEGDDFLYGGAGNDYLSGGYDNGEEGNDSLVGGEGNDTLSGGNGNDTLSGGEGNDFLMGGEGDDSLVGGDGDDFLIGGEGNDSFDGGAGNDSLSGGAGNDSLSGGDSNDSLDGGAGNDFLIGGEGSDRFVYSTRSVIFNSVNFGVDVISDFETGSDKIVLNKTTFNSISSLVGTKLSDLGEFATVTSDANAATSSADIVYNSVNGNLFYNANGSDPGLGTGSLLLTLTGAPTLVASDFLIEASPLWLYGGEGNDTLVGSGGNDSLSGGAGNDFLIGSEGDDSLNGGYGNGNDSLSGGAGNDSLIGSEGDDLLMGGQGSDRFVYSTDSVVFNPVNFGVDVISDFETGSDKIVLNKTTFNSISSPLGEGLSFFGEFATVATDADAATSSADIIYNSVNGNLFYNANGSDPGLGTGSLLLTLTGVPTLVATDFLIEASSLSVYGGTGDDTLVGGDVDDYLYDEEGNDFLFGGDGNDYLSGGDGNDTLMGGQGSDYFYTVYERVFGGGFFGVDVISDFETGTDTILLNKSIFTEIRSDLWTSFSVAEEFAIVTCDTQAAISTAIIVYNSANGNLFYNTNGSDPGLGTGSLFATLTGTPTLAATDFFITAPQLD